MSIVLLMKKVHVLLTLNFLTLDLVDQLHEKKKLLVHVQYTITEYMKLHYSYNEGD